MPSTLQLKITWWKLVQVKAPSQNNCCQPVNNWMQLNWIETFCLFCKIWLNVDHETVALARENVERKIP